MGLVVGITGGYGLGFLLLALTAGAAVLLTRMTVRRHDGQPRVDARDR
jgi:hypothetical protein